MDKPPKSIRLATLFSGIGAIEQAFIKTGLPHQIVFACDNGERDLIPLPTAERKEYATLKKKEDKKETLTDAEQDKLNSLNAEVEAKYAEIKSHVLALKSKAAKVNYVKKVYDKYAGDQSDNVSKTYSSNYKIRPSDYHADIRFMDGRDYAGKVDLLVGGSPCQSFSSNGRRGGIADTRGTLFYEYARIIDEVRPKCFIFENVKGMLVHDKKRTWPIIKQAFEELDYEIHLNHDKNGNEFPLLNAADYGIPQNRERIFLIGIRRDIKLRQKFSFPTPVELTGTVSDYLEPSVEASYYLGKKGFEFVTTHPTRAQVGRPVMNCQKANQQFNWNGDFIFEPLSDKHSDEILARAHVGRWNGQIGVIRKFTPRECLRLMGFPDSFKIVVDDTTMYRQCGNSIVVNVLEKLMEELIKTGIFQTC